MKKLNKKGMTTIEILITFVLIAIISASLYASIISLSNKHTLATYKNSLVTYRDLLTKEIQDDLIIKGLESVEQKGGTVYILHFKDGSAKDLIISKTPIKIDENSATPCKKSTKDYRSFIIYGSERYKLPDIGSENVLNGTECSTLYSLEMGDVSVTTNNNVFDMYVELKHPDLGNKYSIHIVSPINY